MNHRSYEQELLHIICGLPENRRDQFIVRYTSQCRAPGLVFGWSVFLGDSWCGSFCFRPDFIGHTQTHYGRWAWCLGDC